MLFFFCVCVCNCLFRVMLKSADCFTVLVLICLTCRESVRLQLDQSQSRVEMTVNQVSVKLSGIHLWLAASCLCVCVKLRLFRAFIVISAFMLPVRSQQHLPPSERAIPVCFTFFCCFSLLPTSSVSAYLSALHNLSSQCLAPCFKSLCSS